MTTSRKKAFDNTEFLHSRNARSLRILSEYLEPEKRFQEMGLMHTAVFFGSARINSGDTKFDLGKYNTLAEELAYELALFSDELEKETSEKLIICTGGGPGIMEAANRGASRAGKPTIGLNIELPLEQEPNRYITPELSFEFHYFFMRKLWFLYQAKAIIVFPGGFGTMDELFETLTLIQTRKLQKFNIPILLFDRDFWEDTVNFKKLVDYDLISQEDYDILHYCSTIEEGLIFLKPRLKEIMKNIHDYLQLKFPI